MLSSDLQKLSVMGLVTLYELDATAQGAGIIRWHGHIGFEDILIIEALAGRTDMQVGDVMDKAGAEILINELLVGRTNRFVGNTEEYAGAEYDFSGLPKQIKTNIIWQGQTYSPVAIKTDGLEMRGDGRTSSPVLAIGNNINGINGAVTQLCALHSDFVNANLRVITVLAKHLDSANFTEGNYQADSSQFNEQYWTVEQKTQESYDVVSFELANPLAAQRKQIPARDITNYCHWAVCGDYRGESCGYTGASKFTQTGQPTNNAELDKCGGRLSDCKIRFGQYEPLGFGGFATIQLPR